MKREIKNKQINKIVNRHLIKKSKSLLKKLVLLTFLIIAFFNISISYSEESENLEETISEQQEEFGISEFIKDSKKYTGKFFEDIDIGEILQNAIKGDINNESFFQKIISLFGTEFVASLKAISSILVVILVHSVLKSITEGLENNNISKLVYYVQYIIIVTIIMTNFHDIIEMVQETCINLVGFMNILVPLLISLMLYTGSITTSSVIEPIILFAINFVGNIIQTIIVPAVLVLVSLIILSKLSDKIQIDKISKFMKSGITWLLGIILTIFVGILSLEGTLSSSVDGITAKATKSIVSSAIPIVGKVLGDAVDTVLGCGIILKNAVGVIGVLIVVGICIVPILKLATLTISYKLLAGICEPIADEKIVKLLEQIGDIFKIFLAILASLSFMLIIGTALVLKISNSGMMYR